MGSARRRVLEGGRESEAAEPLSLGGKSSLGSTHHSSKSRRGVVRVWAGQMVKSGACAAALSWVTGLASRLEHLLTARPPQGLHATVLACLHYR